VRSRSGGADTVNHSLNVSADFRRKLNERLALNPQKRESDTAPASVPSASAQSTLPDSPQSNLASSLSSAVPMEMPPQISSAEISAAEDKLVWWPGAIWTLGAAIFGVRTAFIRFLLLIFRARYGAPAGVTLQERVGA